MAEASRHFVNLDELMEAAGRRLAELTGAEWGIVTCGSAAAVALGTAACVAGNDPVKMLRLPFTEGMVNRVLIPQTQRFAYDQAVRMIGCHLVEIDTRADLDAALAEPVAMVVMLGKQEHFGSLRLEEIAAVVKPRGIPIMVDAASEHLERPSPWLVRGADLVVYSGGKFLRGPQTSGLLLGAKPLVQAAWSNASPHQALGRPMKVSKEDIVGVLTAVEHWFEERDHAGRAAAMVRRFGGHRRAGPGIARCGGRAYRAERRRPSAAAARLRDRWQYPLEGLALRQQVLDGEPRIMLDDNSATENSIAIDPFQLQPGEAAQVGDAIAAVLREASRHAPAPDRPPETEIAGNWELRDRLPTGLARPPPRSRAARPRTRRPSALDPFRGPGQWLAQRRPDPALVHLALRRQHDLLFLRRPDPRREHDRHRDARRRQRPEPRHRQSQPVRPRPLAGEPRRVSEEGESVP